MDGKRLKEARRARGLTQAELGRLIGVGKSAVSQYEHGIRRPETAVLARLAGVLGVSADWLLGLEDGGVVVREAQAPYEAGNRPPEEEARGFLAELCAQAGAITTRENRRILLEMARFLAQKEAESRPGPGDRPKSGNTRRRGRNS